MFKRGMSGALQAIQKRNQHAADLSFVKKVCLVLRPVMSEAEGKWPNMNFIFVTIICHFIGVNKRFR